MMSLEDATGLSTNVSPAAVSRTIMFDELTRLFDAVGVHARLDDYLTAMIDENALHKATVDGRKVTARYLRDRYVLSPASPLFRAFRHLWSAELGSRRMLTLLAAAARDPFITSSIPTLIHVPPGEVVKSTMFDDAVASIAPGRFNPSTVEIISRRISSSWSQAGHLQGHVRKVRVRQDPNRVCAVFALYIGHLEGRRGDGLFESPWVLALDVPPSRVRELAVEGTRAGWIEYRHAGGFTDISFQRLEREAATP